MDNEIIISYEDTLNMLDDILEKRPRMVEQILF